MSVTPLANTMCSVLLLDGNEERVLWIKRSLESMPSDSIRHLSIAAFCGGHESHVIASEPACPLEREPRLAAASAPGHENQFSHSSLES